MRESRLLVAAAVSIGLLLGIGLYAVVYARGYCYLTKDPAACANCHVMRDHFAELRVTRPAFIERSPAWAAAFAAAVSVKVFLMRDFS